MPNIRTISDYFWRTKIGIKLLFKECLVRNESNSSFFHICKFRDVYRNVVSLENGYANNTFEVSLFIDFLIQTFHTTLYRRKREKRAFVQGNFFLRRNKVQTYIRKKF